jgi:hypothetical protein
MEVFTMTGSLCEKKIGEEFFEGQDKAIIFLSRM